MSTRINVETERRKDHLFRFGQAFDYENLKFKLNRNPYANFLTDGVFRDAIVNGFDVVDDKGDIVGWNEQFQIELAKWWNTILKIGKYERGYGKALIVFFKTEEGELYLNVFEPKQYSIEYDDRGIPTKIDVYEKVWDRMNNEHNLEGDSLMFAKEVIIRSKDILGQGQSLLEPIWDTLYSLQTLSANATYFAIRTGAGIKILRVPEAKMNDPNFRAQTKSLLQSIDSTNTTITLPIIQGASEQADLEIKSGDQIDFLHIRDLLLGDISVGTGIPREVLLGSELGLRSADTNQSAYFRVLEQVQKEYMEFFKWIVVMFNKFHEWYSVEDEEPGFHIKYSKKEEINDKEQTEILALKAQILTTLMNNGVSADSALQLLDLRNLDIDESKKVNFGMPMAEEDVDEEEDEEVEEPEDAEIQEET